MTSTVNDGGNCDCAVRAEIAIGEALFASTLATVVLTGQVASGRLSHDQAASMLDGATLVLERRRGPDSANATAVDYARDRIDALVDQLNEWRQLHP